MPTCEHLPMPPDDLDDAPSARRARRQRRFRLRLRIFAGSFLAVCVLLGVAYAVARFLQAG